MFWQAILVLTAAIAAYFIPTPQELRDNFNGAQNLFAASNYKPAISLYDKIILTDSPLLKKDSIRVTILNGELTISVLGAAYYQKANAYKNLKQYDSAIAVFRTVEQMNFGPDLRGLAQFQIYDIYYMQQAFKDVVREARTLVEKYPDHRKAESALYDIGWAYKEIGELPRSSEAFYELITFYPSTAYLAKAMYQLGQNYFEEGNYDRAINYWSVLGEKFKPSAFKETEWEKIQLKAVKDRQLFDAISSRETESSDLELVAKSQVKIGDAYRFKNNYDSAMVNWKRTISQYSLLPALVEATYIKMGDYTKSEKGINEAILVYKNAIDANFANKELQAKMQFKIAETYQKDSIFVKAADEYRFYASAYAEVAEVISFPVEDALYTEVLCYFAIPDYRNTIARADSFVNNFPGNEFNYDLIFLTGISYFNLRELLNADERFDQVIELGDEKTQYMSASLYKVRIRLEEKKAQEALTILTELSNKFAGGDREDEISFYFIQANFELKNYSAIPQYFSKIPPSSMFFVPAIIRVSKSYVLDKKLDEAEKFALDLIAMADTIKDATYFFPEVRFSLADVYIAKIKYEEAIAQLNFVIDDAKSNNLLRLQSRYLRGTLYGQLSKHKESIADLEYVLADSVFGERMPQLVPNARGRLATAYTKTGQVQKGVDLMLSFVASAKDTLEKVRYMVALVEVFYEMKDMKNVIKYGNQTLAYNFDDEYLYSRASFLLGMANNVNGNIDEALKILARSAQRYPAINEEILFNFAVNLYDIGYYDNAAKAFVQFIERYPESKSVRNSMFFIGYAHYNIGKWDESIKEFRAFLAKYPADEFSAEAQYNVAEAYYNQGMFAESIAEYEKTQTNFPKSDFGPSSLYNMAWSYYQLKDIDKMIAPLQKLIATYPGDKLVPEAQFTIGDYFYNKKEYTRALLEYRNFVDRFPDHYKATEARSFIQELSQIDAFREYQKAIVIFDKKDYKNAIIELEKIVAKYPDSEVAMACEANIASSYEQLKDFKKALELFKQIVEKYKDNPNAAGIVYFAEQHIEWIEEGNETAGL